MHFSLIIYLWMSCQIVKPSEYKIVNSIRGNPLITHKGFSYCVNKCLRHPYKYWRCSSNTQSRRCCVTAKLILEGGLIIKGNHSHPPRSAWVSPYGYYNYEFVKSRKGALKLLHQGYEYISSVSDRTQPLRLWRCCRYMYHQQVCGASAVLEAGGKLTLLGVHNHLPAKLLHKGYEYLFEDKNNERKLYRCHRYLSPDTPCMAKAVITEKGDLTLIGGHDHPPDK